MKNKRQKKVLIIGPLPPPAHGEALAIADVAKAIKKKIILNTNHSQLNYFSGFRLFNAFKDIFLMAVFLFKVWQVDILYLSLKRSFWGGLKDLYFINVAKLLNKRIVAHVHGGSFTDYYNSLVSVHKKIVTNTLAKINKIIVLSSFSQKQFLSLCAPNKLTIINNYITDIRYQRKKYNTTGPLKILYLSHVVEEKGIFAFLSSAEKAQQLKMAWQFDIYGHFSVKNKKKFSSLLQKLKNTTYLNELTKNKLTVLQKYDILIFPSLLKEGQPLVILEAMSAGLTVLSNNIGGVADIIESGRTGFLIKNNQQSEYFSVLQKITSERALLKKIGNAAGQEIVKNYSIKNLAKILEVLYED